MEIKYGKAETLEPGIISMFLGNPAKYAVQHPGRISMEIKSGKLKTLEYSDKTPEIFPCF